MDSQTPLSLLVSGSLKTLSILTFLFNPSINIRNQGKFICVNWRMTGGQRDKIWYDDLMKKLLAIMVLGLL